MLIYENVGNKMHNNKDVFGNENIWDLLIESELEKSDKFEKYY